MGIDSHVHEFYVDGAWSDFDITAATGGPTAAAGSSLANAVDTTQNLFRVHYVGTDSHVHEFYDDDKGWHDFDITAAVGGPTAAAGSPLANAVDTTQNLFRVHYVGSDSHVHEFYVDGQGWHDFDLAAATAGPDAWAHSYTFNAGHFQLAQGTSASFGSLSLTMQSDGNLVLYQNGTTLWSSNTSGQNCGSNQCFAASRAMGISWSTTARDRSGSPGTGSSAGAQLVLSGQAPYLTILASNQSSLWANSTPLVQLANLTHSNLAPEFEVGDTFQITISQAPPHQTVFVSQTPGTTRQVGQTDANGNFTLTGVEQTSNIGSYTQVWSVGGVRITPAISYLVGQLGGGTVSTTDLGQTSDGSVTGVSTISITNGAVSTYSVTELDYQAQSYYDAYTVATLRDNGSLVTSAQSYITPGSAGGTLSATANAWDDYTLQTDHYVVAYLISGGYYENPLYFGNGSGDDSSGDVVFEPGGGLLYITADSIYIGSTIADQTAVPQDGSLPIADDSYLNSFLSTSGSIPPSQVTMKVDQWKAALAAAWTASLIEHSANPSVVLPFILQVVGDCEYGNQPNGLAERDRSYRVLDGQGHPWNNANPLLVNENILTYSGPPVTGNGAWGTPGLVIKDEELVAGTFVDELTQGKIGIPQQEALQQFWARGFNVPSGFTLPGVSGFPSPTIPLLVVDGISKTHKGLFGSLGNVYTQRYIGINGDTGDAPNFYYVARNGGLNLPPQACGGP